MMKLFFYFKFIDKFGKYNLDVEELVNLAGFGNRSMLQWRAHVRVVPSRQNNGSVYRN